MKMQSGLVGLVTTLLIAILLAVSAGSARAETCYECVVGGPGWMDCIHPVKTGHISCVPYATTCSVGAPCSPSFHEAWVTPDGSFRGSGVPVLNTQLAEDGTVRSCLGYIEARALSVAAMKAIEHATLEIVI